MCHRLLLSGWPKKLGTKGFADFKVQLATELSAFAQDAKEISVDIPIPSDCSTQDIANTFYNLSRQVLDITMNELDVNALRKAATMLVHADTIHLYGRGESLIVAEDFHYKLLRIGLNSQLETLNGFPEAHARMPRARLKEAALIVSQYCNNRQLHYVIDELMSAGIPFILLTAAENPWPYDKYAAVTLRISCKESRYKMGSFASRNAMLFLLDCLYGEIFSRQYERNKENLTAFSKRKTERDYYYT
ncbi:MAG: MurR/RpiR family transcriptional regulator [Clostridiales bacterium]|nr:MurR/RpiR family transcriptional regulator [Clostridiales bacterium]